MNLKSISVTIIIFISFQIQATYSQLLDYELHNVRIKNMVVKSEDTCIKVYKYIGQTGGIGFSRGFADTSKFVSTLTYVTDPKTHKGIDKVWKSEFIFLEDIDTIPDFFSCDKNLPLQQDTIIEKYKKITMCYYTDTYLTSVKFSFVVNWLVDNTTFSYSKSSIIYLCPDPFSKLEKYWIYKFEPNEHKSTNLSLYIIMSVDSSGYYLSGTDSTTVSERKLKKFYKRLGDVKKLEKSDYCDLDGEESVLLAVNDKRFIYSWYCSIKRDKKMKGVWRFIKEFNELVWYSSMRKTIEKSIKDCRN